MSEPVFDEETTWNQSSTAGEPWVNRKITKFAYWLVPIVERATKPSYPRKPLQVDAIYIYPGNINAENFYKDHGSPDAGSAQFGTPLPNLYHLLHQIRCENGLKIREGRISATGQTLLRKGRFEFVIWVVAPALGEHPTLERLEFLWSRSGSYFSFGFYRPDTWRGHPGRPISTSHRMLSRFRSDLHEQFDQYEFGFEQGLNLIPIRRELVLSAIAFAFLRKPALQGFRET
ncbi:hypothetical protein B0H14DRAFT_2616992 [Mycena olivaceomarginata]|nr:hypothetical protein B0H14DRAFT_2616992 [Mycena olivaceomarginata]